jgi:hypothetical protein
MEFAPYTAYLDIELKISQAKKLLTDDPGNTALKKEVRLLERDYGIAEKLLHRELDRQKERTAKIIFTQTGEEVEFRLNFYEELIINRTKH